MTSHPTVRILKESDLDHQPWSNRVRLPVAGRRWLLVQSVDGQDQELIVLEDQPWDTEVLRLKSGRLSQFSLLTDSSREALQHVNYKTLVQSLFELKMQYVLVRLPQQDWRRIQALEAVHFGQVDGILEFRKKVEGTPALSLPAGFAMRHSRVEDLERLSDLATQTFTLSRYHADPVLPTDVGDRAMASWTKNSLVGSRVDQVFVVEHATDGPVGFITCRKAESTGTIELVAVDVEQTGRGLGSLLVQQACNWFVVNGVQHVHVQTQTHNHIALRLYSKLGFEPIATSVTLRWCSI